MDRHLDFTIDFETCGLGANAAVMQVAVLPWLRDNFASPFCNEDELKPYVGYVDLRRCVMDGFEFEPKTLRWWREQSEEAKSAVCDGKPEQIDDITWNVLHYIDGVMSEYKLESICLWSQGPDVDMAILRHLCSEFGIDLEKRIQHTSFRDCRTMILEAALLMAGRIQPDGAVSTAPSSPSVQDILSDSRRAYELFDPLPYYSFIKGRAQHDALYDCARSTWYTWQALKELRKP